MRHAVKKTLWLLLLTSTFTLGPIVVTAATTELKLAHTMITTDTFNEAALKFAELVKEKTKGSLEIKVYPNGQLGTDPQILQSVRLGSIDIGVAGVPWYTSFAPWLGALNLPFIFRGYDHAYRILDGDLGKELSGRLESVGMKALGFPELGFRNITTTKQAIKNPEHVKGLKLRTTGDPYHVLCWKLLGVLPTPMPWAEVYMGLKTGTVDGQENPVTVIHAAKLYEVQKHLSLTMHAYTAHCATVNLNKYKSLSALEQNALQEAMAEAISFQRRLNREAEKPMLEEMEKAGMLIERSPNRDAFAAIVKKPVEEEFIKTVGTGIIEKIGEMK
jgi:TRAP-type transport system periplasmic protein